MTTPGHDDESPGAVKRLRRLLVASPLWAALGLTSWVILAFTGWGSETAPSDQVARDAVPFAISAVTGSAAVAVICRALGAALGYAVVGTIPALVMVTAYFTTLY